MTRTLPDDSHIDRLRGEAKDLLRRFRDGDAEADELLGQHAKFRGLSSDEIRAAGPSLQERMPRSRVGVSLGVL
tara:strand:- start:97 stop:318 length:222 start_codon:yes stop_codon:yes gene_type:complete